MFSWGLRAVNVGTRTQRGSVPIGTYPRSTVDSLSKLVGRRRKAAIARSCETRRAARRACPRRRRAVQASYRREALRRNRRCRAWAARNECAESVQRSHAALLPSTCHRRSRLRLHSFWIGLFSPRRSPLSHYPGWRAFLPNGEGSLKQASQVVRTGGARRKLGYAVLRKGSLDQRWYV